MPKYKIRITYAYIVALCHWLDGEMEREANTSFECIAVWVLLHKWLGSEQVRNLCTFTFAGEKKLSLKPEIAAALAYAIGQKELDTTNYLDNYLRIAYGEIHQFFNLKK